MTTASAIARFDQIDRQRARTLLADRKPPQDPVVAGRLIPGDAPLLRAARLLVCPGVAFPCDGVAARRLGGSASPSAKPVSVV